MKILIFVTILCSPLIYGAKSHKMDDKLANLRREVLEQGGRLKKLEVEINNKKNLYESSLASISQFEADLILYQGQLKSMLEDLNKTEKDRELIINSYIAETENESLEPWQIKIHSNLLEISQRKFIEQSAEIKSYQNKILQFQLKLEELKRDETTLLYVINSLESKKKNTTVDLEKKKSLREKFMEKIEKSKVVKKLNQKRKEIKKANKSYFKPDRIFAYPMDNFKALKESDKGVTFRYLGLQPVKAVGEGKIIYAGDLANYGQVVIIDHGKELRSVLLGNLSLKIKKNDQVKKGEILGYTKQDSLDDSQSVYFEVRKSNTAQNTILWLDQASKHKI